MPINKYMRRVLRAVSYLEPDVKNFYPFRRQTEAVAARLRLMPPGVQDYERPVSGAEGSLRLRIFRETAAKPRGGILFFHGGGWVTGDTDSYARVCAHLALHTHCTVAALEYRLAPEHPYPAATEDCYAAARELFAQGLPGVPPERICIMGDSAGGNLAAVVSLMTRDRVAFMPAAQILVYPAVGADHSESSPYPSIHENGRDYLLTAKQLREYMDLYCPDPIRREEPYVAPLMAKDLSAQPPSLIITAQYDPLRDEGELYGLRLREAGNRVRILRLKGALHGCFTLPAVFAHPRKIMSQTAAFLEDLGW